MRVIDRLGLAQRVVIVIGLGLMLVVLGRFIVTRGGTRVYGWVAYAPLSRTAANVGGMAPWARLLVWLVIISVWTVASTFVLRRRSGGQGT